MARARAVRADRPKGIRTAEAKVLEAFVDLVSRLPFVERVYAMPGYEGVEIRTVIDAEPFNFGAEKQAYDAELQARDRSSKAMVLFDLINRREHSGDSFDDVLPSVDRLAWRRTG